jgi:heterodisulfide reductase subunit A
MPIGVFICRCGGNISGTVKVEEVADIIRKVPGVAVVRIADFTCSKPGLDTIKDSVRRFKLDGVVVASCSPHMHEETFRNTVEEAGLNRYKLVHVNIREQCSWVHTKGATEKAVDLILAGIARAKVLEPLEKIGVEVSRDIMVIGGGIAGITSALHLADAGYRVYLVERRPSIGGRMAQLSKTFPTLDCAPCILSPKMSEMGRNPNIVLLTNSEVSSVSGGPGNFQVRIQKKPRGVNPEKCLKCGRCEKECPVETLDEFEEGLLKRKAVHLPFPQAVPSAYAIDFDACTLCGKCAEVCPAKAIDLEEGDREVDMNVGSIIVATGFDLLDLDKLKSYNPQNPNCITALQMERLIETELTAGKVLKKADGSRVKSIAYILCAGSRDPHRGLPYCSRICCPYAIKEAILLKEFLPYLNIWIYYTDMRMSGRGFEEFYNRARDLGIRFIHGRPGEVKPAEEERLEVLAEDLDSGTMLRNLVDTVVLCTGIVASKGTDELAQKLGIPLGEDKFIASKHPKLDPISTLRDGIYAAGNALGPEDIHESVIDARAAAAHAMNFVGNGERLLDPIKPRLVGECDGCLKCLESCIYRALSFEGGKLVVDPFSCVGCGACVAACPKSSLDLSHYRRKQLEEEMKGLLSRENSETVILGFFEDRICYTAADNAGTTRLSYPTNIRIVRVPSNALLDQKLILKALLYGADGIFICESEAGKELKIVEELVASTKALMSKKGIEAERIRFQSMVLPIFRVLPQYISDFQQTVNKLGKIPKEKRERLI